MDFVAKLNRKRVQEIEEIVWCHIDADTPEAAAESAVAFVKSHPEKFENKWVGSVIESEKPVRPRVKCEVFSEADVDKLPEVAKAYFK